MAAARRPFIYAGGGVITATLQPLRRIGLRQPKHGSGFAEG